MAKLIKRKKVFEEDLLAKPENSASLADLNKQSESVDSNAIVKHNEHEAVKISVISIAANVCLSFFKLIAGLVGMSWAMVADAIHSFSDVLTTFIVIAGVKMSAKKADKNHPYGHDRFECVAALILAFILFDIGLVIGYSAVVKLVSGEYLTAQLPKAIALVAAVASILVQVVMFALTRAVAKKINSGALKADAWHHLSDSLSSVGSFIGILGAMMGAPILDIIASLVICLIILKVAIDVFIDSVNKITDRAVDENIENQINELAKSVDGVQNIDSLQTRQFGNMIYVDIEIACDGKLSLEKAHFVAHKVHDKIESNFAQVKHCNVHVNPYSETLIFEPGESK